MKKPEIVPAQSVTVDMMDNHHKLHKSSDIMMIQLSPITEGLDTREGTSFDQVNENDVDGPDDGKSETDTSQMYGDQDIVTPISGQSLHQTPKSDINVCDTVMDDMEDSDTGMYKNDHETPGGTMDGHGEDATPS